MQISLRQRIHFHRGIIILLLRLCLGGMFLYAGIHKIHNIAGFRDAVANYEILPYWIVNIAVIIIPWLEFLIGSLLILGIFVKACTMLNCMLLMLFNIAIGINIHRGVEIYCGCFSEKDFAGVTNLSHISLNMLWLFIASVLFIMERRRFSHRFFSRNTTQR